MTIPNLCRIQNKFACFVAGWRRSVLTGLGLFFLTGVAHAWITLDLPNLNAPPGVLAVSHLPDGRFIYGNGNALYTQNTFGATGVTSFASVPSVDPSFITVLNNTTAVIGAGGGFGVSPVYQFNPSSPASPGFSAVTTLQNYAGAPAGASSLFIDGSNGSGTNDFDLPNNAVSYVTLAGQQQLLVDNAGGFSSGLAVDGTGDLFVSDDDNFGVYKFTAAQVQNAIAHATTLSLLGDGTLLHTFDADVVGSLAVDADGRIWAAGFGANGLFWFDPSSGLSGSLNPETGSATDPAYTLSTFSANGSNYVSYIWQSDFANGSTVHYGYDTVQNVPEPATVTLWAALAAGVAAFCKRRHRATLS